MNDIKYTFLLPTYKPNFLEQALVSIKNQTYTNFNVIVSDDCSPYDLKKIYDKVCSGDSRFSYRRNEKNMGGNSLVSHWNLLVCLCNTDYLIMASDDDVYELDFLEEIDKLVCKYPNVDLFRGRAREIDSMGKEIRQDFAAQEYLDSLHFIQTTCQSGFIFCESNYVYKSCTLKAQQGFVDFPKAWFSDDATHIKMSKNGCCTTNHVTFAFRISDLSISGKRRNSVECIAKVKASYQFYIWMEKYLNHFYADLEQTKQISEQYKTKVIRNVQEFIYGCPFGLFLKLLLKCPQSLGLNRARMFLHWFRWRI